MQKSRNKITLVLFLLLVSLVENVKDLLNTDPITQFSSQDRFNSDVSPSSNSRKSYYCSSRVEKSFLKKKPKQQNKKKKPNKAKLTEIPFKTDTEAKFKTRKKNCYNSRSGLTGTSHFGGF